MSGYQHCQCRDCFEIVVAGPDGALCDACEEAGCDGAECQVLPESDEV